MLLDVVLYYILCKLYRVSSIIYYNIIPWLANLIKFRTNFIFLAEGKCLVNKRSSTRKKIYVRNTFVNEYKKELTVMEVYN